MSYLFLKSLHIIFVITWFAGLFYIVRLFIYHSEALAKEEPAKRILADQLALMSKKLWYIITWPSAILTLIFGASLLWLQPFWLQMPFMRVKLGFVLVLFIYHLACHKIFRQLQKNVAAYSPTQLRIFNEVATIILFAVVFLIVMKNAVSWIWGTLGLITFAVLLLLAVKLYKRIREKK